MTGHFWIICALSASVLWGFSYAIAGRMMEYGFTPSFLMAAQYLVGLPVYLGIAIKTSSVRNGFQQLADHPSQLALLLAELAAIIAGNFLILFSISLKNATLASLIEISYPVFTAIFALVLFKETQFNLVTMAGAALIFSGIGIIYLKS